MANKLYEEEAIRAVAEAIRLKLAYPDGTKAANGDKYDITDMSKTIKDIPVRLGFPSKNVTNISTLSSNGGTWYATGNGWVYYCVGNRSTIYSRRTIKLENATQGVFVTDSSYATTNNCWYQARSDQAGYNRTATSGYNQNGYLILPVAKNDVVIVTISGASASTKVVFVEESDTDKRSKLRPATA